MDDDEVCPQCDGTEEIECDACDGDGSFKNGREEPIICDQCGGLGTLECPECG